MKRKLRNREKIDKDGHGKKKDKEKTHSFLIKHE